VTVYLPLFLANKNVQLIVLREELDTCQQLSYKSAFFRREGLVPMIMFTSTVAKSIWKGMFSWKRENIVVDDYGFTVESKGHCAVSGPYLLGESFAAHMCFVLYVTYVFVRLKQKYLSSLKSSNLHIGKQLNQLLQFAIFQSLGFTAPLSTNYLYSYGISELLSLIMASSVYGFIVVTGLFSRVHSTDTEVPSTVNKQICIYDKESDISSITNPDFVLKSSKTFNDEAKTSFDLSLECLANIDNAHVQSTCSLVS